LEIVFVRIGDNGERVSKPNEELERCNNAKKVMPWFFRRGKFTVKVIAKQTPFAISHNLRNLPYKAFLTYESCGTEVVLEYHEWCVLSRQYYSPDIHTGIKIYWDSTGI
tara:strand:+ start:1388 stop:1714 length:327 start_codon:yes stop_codon:yes gene_type:complete